ncbi:MAG: hypothetical protein GM46_12335 [actinobacterium acAcidi]|nr:MAG: hypothetical protein GM46_12335 [actinobacterium acAcidi]
MKEIEVSQLAEKIAAGYKVVDVRELNEYNESPTISMHSEASKMFLSFAKLVGVAAKPVNISSIKVSPMLSMWRVEQLDGFCWVTTLIADPPHR